MPDAQAARSQKIDDRVDALAVLEADLPHGTRARYQVTVLGQLIVWHRLVIGQSHYEQAALLRQFRRRAEPDQLTRLQNRDPIADQLNFPQQVRVEKNRFALLF